MVSFTSTAIAIVAALSIATPVAAGPLALIGTAVSAATSIAGAVKKHHKVRGESELWTRDDELWTRDAAKDKVLFQPCLAALKGHKLVHQKQPDGSVTLKGLPKVCHDALLAHNADPANAATKGAVTPIGEDGAHVKPKTGEFAAFIESLP